MWQVNVSEDRSDPSGWKDLAKSCEAVGSLLKWQQAKTAEKREQSRYGVLTVTRSDVKESDVAALMQGEEDKWPIDVSRMCALANGEEGKLMPIRLVDCRGETLHPVGDHTTWEDAL